MKQSTEPKHDVKTSSLEVDGEHPSKHAYFKVG